MIDEKLPPPPVYTLTPSPSDYSSYGQPAFPDSSGQPSQSSQQVHSPHSPDQFSMQPASSHVTGTPTGQPMMQQMPSNQTWSPSERPPQQQQQQGYAVPPVPQMPPPAVVGTQPLYSSAVAPAALQSASAPVDCPACGKRAMTNLTPVAGNTTLLWALGFLVISCMPCIPYFMASTKDARHNCSQCGALLATWQRSGRTVVHAHASA